MLVYIYIYAYIDVAFMQLKENPYTIHMDTIYRWILFICMNAIYIYIVEPPLSELCLTETRVN
jgi:hypothetical protein